MALDPITRTVRTELFGESLRELGVLVLIFFPLDILLESKGSINWSNVCWGASCLSGRYVVMVFFAIVGIVLLYLGIKIESEAKLALIESEEK